MNTKKVQWIGKKMVIVIAIVVMVFLIIFLMGRYGWKLGGFHACQSAGISSVEVNEQAVHIVGFYPGSFPQGFCGYYSEERDGTLFVGFRFSGLFGFFETGNFDITIPVKDEINEVVVKTRKNEYSLWTAQTGFTSSSANDGIYVKLEQNDVYTVSLSYEGFSGDMDCLAMESGEWTYMHNQIMAASRKANAPVPFTITVKNADGAVVASGDFSFDANRVRMFLTVTADGRIVEDNGDAG